MNTYLAHVQVREPGHADLVEFDTVVVTESAEDSELRKAAERVWSDEVQEGCRVHVDLLDLATGKALVSTGDQVMTA
jgi:hypothetical protein